MRNLLLLAAVAVFAVSVFTVQDVAAKGKAKGQPQVPICHLPPGNPDNVQFITVGATAVDDHVRLHGDGVGTTLEECFGEESLCEITANECSGDNYSIVDPQSADCACVCDLGDAQNNLCDPQAGEVFDDFGPTVGCFCTTEGTGS